MPLITGKLFKCIFITTNADTHTLWSLRERTLMLIAPALAANEQVRSVTVTDSSGKLIWTSEPGQPAKPLIPNDIAIDPATTAAVTAAKEKISNESQPPPEK